MNSHTLRRQNLNLKAHQFATSQKDGGYDGIRTQTPSLRVMCFNQLSYGHLFSRNLIGVVGRIMRIGPASVNLFFKEKSL
ncbi:hypothetical protein MJ561_09115 [Klebsiella pneumoniae]|nr:hypothetical protein MJ561_09115 [Klebsiella pneumoniae]